MDELVALLLAGILTFVFGWNNSSILIGNERGSGTLSARESTILCSVGMLLGVAIEGSKMHGSLGGLVSGAPSETVVTTTLVLSIALTLVLTSVAIPVSFSNTMVGAFVGAALASSLSVRGEDVATVVGFWVVAPLATMGLTFAVYRSLERWAAGRSLVTVDAVNRAGVGLVSLALAYVLSANNIGLIYGTAFTTAGGGPMSPGGSLPLALILGGAAIVAMAVFGRGAVAGTVGDRLLSLSPLGVLSAFTATIAMMLVATQLGIPISVTQCLIGGMFGAAFTKKVSVINERLALEVVASWVVVPAIAFVLAFVAVPLV